jgi:hypothetical protein
MIHRLVDKLEIRNSPGWVILGYVEGIALKRA